MSALPGITTKSSTLTHPERTLLLQLARQALEDGVCRGRLPVLNLDTLPPVLQQPGAAFVTLTRCGELRGCIGTLEAYQPLAQDVRERTVAAALHDYRFMPVTPDELPELKIEISRLTSPEPLPYQSPIELVSRLRVGMDGVILRDGARRATFLPQVWEKLPDPAQFLSQLCHKMGAPPDIWRHKKLRVFTYQVEEMHEENPSPSPDMHFTGSG